MWHQSVVSVCEQDRLLNHQNALTSATEARPGSALPLEWPPDIVCEEVEAAAVKAAEVRLLLRRYHYCSHV